MWRRDGDVTYALLVLGGLVLQAAALALLTWTFIPIASDLLPEVGPWRGLLVALLVSVAILLTVVGFILGYHVLSASRQRRRGEEIQEWSDRWLRVLFGEAPPSGPLPDIALEGLLEVRDRLRGDHARKIGLIFERYWHAGELLRPLRSRRLLRRLDALDRLARARLGSTFFPMLRDTNDADAQTRALAIRASARTLALLPDGPAMEHAGAAFALALDDERIPTGVALESLILLEEAASSVICHLLGPETPPRLRRAAVEAAGRLERTDLAGTIGDLLEDPDSDPEIRAAALRAIRGMGVVPPGASRVLERAMDDPVDFVRVQAIRASVLLSPATVLSSLLTRLGDRSWWVRRASGEALLRIGAEGRVALERAARDHGDRYARQMAIQLLFDDHRISAPRAEELREATWSSPW